MAQALPFHKSGSMGWVAIAAGVLAWDVLAEDSLTAAFYRARKHPVGATAVVVVWGVLTAHLFGVIPPRADPFIRLRYGHDWERASYLWTDNSYPQRRRPARTRTSVHTPTRS